MEVFELLKDNIKKAVKNIYKIDVKEVVLEHPENEDFGDFATSIALSLAKQVGANPLEIAEGLAGELTSMGMEFKSDGSAYPIFEKIEAVKPGFVNFTLSTEWLKQELIHVYEKKEEYGSSDIGEGKNVLVEYSQPNTNKPQHVGHARNNFIGATLINLMEFLGYKVIRANYVGDIGIHIAKSMLMYQKYGEGKNPDIKPDHFVGDFYIRYFQELEDHPEYEEEAAELLRKWESKDQETRELWQKMNDWVYEGWKQTYEDQGVEFDIWTYESDDIEGGKEMVDEAVKKGVAERDESGAVIAKLEKYGLPDKVLLRSDGTSVYATKDLFLAKDNFDKYNFEKRLYVVDFRQEDYFKQVFKVLELMGYEWAKKLYHVSYGTVTLPEGAMSSRKGNFVNADDVFESIIKVEKGEIKNSLKEVSDIEETSRKVALAAFKYGMLKVDPKQDIVFEYDKVTKFEGNTGPYLMYSYARTQSILEKGGFVESKFTFNLEMIEGASLEKAEKDILRSLYKFPEIVFEAGEKFMPHVLANYLYDLSQRFNAFYGQISILSVEDSGVKTFRVGLTNCVGDVLKTGLRLLGIEVVEKM